MYNGENEKGSIFCCCRVIAINARQTLTNNRTFDSSLFTVASISSAPTFNATVTYHISKLFWHRLALCIFRFQHIIF